MDLPAPAIGAFRNCTPHLLPGNVATQLCYPYLGAPISFTLTGALPLRYPGTEKMVGPVGFEPTTFWSLNNGRSRGI